MTVRRHTSITRRKTFASGKNAKAQCPICGDVVRYTQMVKDWRGVRVCPCCRDPKHPQETPVVTADAVAIREPSPLLDEGTTDPVEPLEDSPGYWTTF